MRRWEIFNFKCSGKMWLKTPDMKVDLQPQHIAFSTNSIQDIFFTFSEFKVVIRMGEVQFEDNFL